VAGGRPVSGRKAIPSTLLDGGFVFFLTNSAGRSGRLHGPAALRTGRSLIDVLEEALREAESNREERSVGLGGRPNLLGEVELDASLMDGNGRRTGSVAAVRGFLHPVSVAKAVMEKLPHEMLVGGGAARFAREIGAEPADLLTPEARDEWRSWLDNHLSAEAAGLWPEIPLAELAWKTAELVGPRDTAIALAGDGTGLASGTTTCGWPFKYPGRLGDSALVGSGHYADSRYGAAACTHTGEMTIRGGTARMAVLLLGQGRTAEQACREALADLGELRGGFLGDVVLYAVDAAGNHFAATTGIEEEYWWWTGEMEAPEQRTARPL
jgi:L-asparaginase / beta-aspartyl-peptidase